MKSGLVDEGDKLVTRKKSGVGESVKDKHCGDVWSLVDSIVGFSPGASMTSLRNL